MPKQTSRFTIENLKNFGILLILLGLLIILVPGGSLKIGAGLSLTGLILTIILKKVG
jgi:hypothetical protein